MMEKKHNEPRDDSYYDELIKQRIGEALRNQSRKERLDLAQLEAWVEEDRQRRRAKVKRILAVASCFVILCLGTFSLKLMFDPDDSIATAGKNDNKVTEEGNNAVVKPSEEGVGENTGVREVQCTSLDDVESIKKKYPKLFEPQYIPDGYKFKSLTVKDSDIMDNYSYLYTNNKNQLEIKQITGADTTIFSRYDRKLECDLGNILVMEDVNITAACESQKGTFYILGCISDEELIKILNNIK